LILEHQRLILSKLLRRLLLGLLARLELLAHKLGLLLLHWRIARTRDFCRRIRVKAALGDREGIIIWRISQAKRLLSLLFPLS
jgi:hypothetical protein